MTRSAKRSLFAHAPYTGEQGRFFQKFVQQEFLSLPGADRRFVPKGSFENSPAFQRRDRSELHKSRREADSVAAAGISAVPSGARCLFRWGPAAESWGIFVCSPRAVNFSPGF